MAQEDFIRDLTAMGFVVERFPDGRIAFPYEVQCGLRSGLQTTMGFQVPPDWPLSPPSGPHFATQIHAIHAGGEHPTGGIHQSPFGGGWQYWSRPYKNWAPTSKPVRQYLAHINLLFETQ